MKRTEKKLDEMDPLNSSLPEFDVNLNFTLPDSLNEVSFLDEGPMNGAGREGNMVNLARKQPLAVSDGAMTDSGLVQSPKVLDLTDACAFLGIAKVTMYSYLKRGVVPAFKYPGSRVWKFDREKLEQWVKSQQEGGSKR